MKKVNRVLARAIKFPAFGKQKKFPCLFFISFLSRKVWGCELGHLLGYPDFPKCKMELNDLRGSIREVNGGEREYSSGMLEGKRKSRFHFTDVTDVLSQFVDVCVAILGDSLKP